MALFTLVVIGALVGVSFFVGRQEQMMGRNSVRLEQAFAAAEAGLNQRVADWRDWGANGLDPGDSTAFAGAVGGTGWYRGSVRRLNERLFLLRSVGFSPDSSARQQVGIFLRLRPLDLAITAALETRAVTRIGGSSFVDGNDRVPSGWIGCPPPELPRPGIRLRDVGAVTTAGCEALRCVAGDPKVAQDTAAGGDGVTVGGVDVDVLRTMATTIVPGGNRRIEPSLADGRCHTGDIDNWGSPLDPTGPCANHFPVVWSDGDLTISGGQGQGILIVDGDLTVQGGFEFVGPSVVLGTFTVVGMGGYMTGGVIAADVSLDQSDALGRPVISYSSCAVGRARGKSASASPLRSRAWVDLR
jgi:hypothetical protein